VVKSTGQDMFIQFVSDNDPDNTRQGFHASFVFEMQNQTMFDGILAGPGYKALDEEQEDINILEGGNFCLVIWIIPWYCCLCVALQVSRSSH